MIFPVSYMFNFGDYIYQLVGIALFGLFGFRNSYNLLLFWVFKSAGFREFPPLQLWQIESRANICG